MSDFFYKTLISVPDIMVAYLALMLIGITVCRLILSEVSSLSPQASLNAEIIPKDRTTSLHILIYYLQIVLCFYASCWTYFTWIWLLSMSVSHCPGCT